MVKFGKKLAPFNQPLMPTPAGYDWGEGTEMTKIQFTKVFIPGSTLEGLEYVETIEVKVSLQPIQERVDDFLHWLNAHTETPVRTCAGSWYTVKDIKVLI